MLIFVAEEPKDKDYSSNRENRIEKSSSGIRVVTNIS